MARKPNVAGSGPAKPPQSPVHMSPGDAAPEGTPGTGQAPCPRCRGSGAIDERSCPHCEGAGYVICGIGGA